MGSKRSFRSDERAIEGLPIRLVIALVVGVAALGIMMNMLGGIGTPGKTEVQVQYPDGDGAVGPPGGQVTVEVVDEEGQEVTNAQVIVSPGTAQMPSGAETYSTGSSSNQVTVDIPSDALRADQTKGTLEVEVIPPSDSDWEDEQSNTEIVVVEGA